MSWWVESRTLIGSFKLQPDATFFWEILQLFSERKTRESRTCRWFSSKIPILWSFGNWGFKLPPYLDAPLFDAVAEMLNPIAKGRGGESPNRKSFGSSSKNWSSWPSVGGALGYVVCADLREVPFSPGLWWEKMVRLKDFQSLQTTANHFFFSLQKLKRSCALMVEWMVNHHKLGQFHIISLNQIEWQKIFAHWFCKPKQTFILHNMSTSPIFLELAARNEQRLTAMRRDSGCNTLGSALAVDIETETTILHPKGGDFNEGCGVEEFPDIAWPTRHRMTPWSHFVSQYGCFQE